MGGVIVIRESDGSLRTEPSNTTIIEADGGVYIAYDIDAAENDFRFEDGAELLGTYYGDVELISDPVDGGSWLSEAEEQF